MFPLVYNFSTTLCDFMKRYPIIVMDDRTPINLFDLFPYLKSGISTTQSIYLLTCVLGIKYQTNFNYSLNDEEPDEGFDETRNLVIHQVNPLQLSLEEYNNVVEEKVILSILFGIITPDKQYLDIVAEVCNVTTNSNNILVQSPITNKIGLAIVLGDIRYFNQNFQGNVKLELMFYYFRISAKSTDEQIKTIVNNNIITNLLLVKEIIIPYLPLELYYYLYNFI